MATLGRVGGRPIGQAPSSAATARGWRPPATTVLPSSGARPPGSALARLRHGGAVTIGALRSERDDRDRERRRHGARLAPVRAPREAGRPPWAQAARSSTPSSAPTARASSRRASTARRGCGTRGRARRSRSPSPTATPSRSATFSPDGARVVTASADQTARIWDARTGTELAVLRGHDNYVGSAEFSPDGKRVVTSSFDQTARVWDAAVGEPLFTIGAQRIPGRERGSEPNRALSSWPRRRTALRASWTPRPAPRSPPSRERRSRRQRRVQRRRPRRRHVGRRRAACESGIRPPAGSGARRCREASPSSPSRARTPRTSSPSASARPIRHTTVALWDRTRKKPVATWRLDGRGQGAGFDASGRRLLAWNEDGSRGRLGHRLPPQACDASRARRGCGRLRSAPTACAWSPAQTTASPGSGTSPAGGR